LTQTVSNYSHRPGACDEWGVFIVGVVQRFDMDERVTQEADVPGRYAAIRPFFFLEPGWFAPLGPASRA